MKRFILMFCAILLLMACGTTKKVTNLNQTSTERESDSKTVGFQKFTNVSIDTTLFDSMRLTVTEITFNDSGGVVDFSWMMNLPDFRNDSLFNANPPRASPDGAVSLRGVANIKITDINKETEKKGHSENNDSTLYQNATTHDGEQTDHQEKNVQKSTPSRNNWIAWASIILAALVLIYLKRNPILGCLKKIFNAVVRGL